jgi:hypothetical protein
MTTFIIVFISHTLCAAIGFFLSERYHSKIMNQVNAEMEELKKKLQAITN